MKRTGLRGRDASSATRTIKLIDKFALERTQDQRPRDRLCAIEPRRILVVSHGRDERLELSARNLPTVEIIPRRLDQRGRPLKDRASSLIEQAALARMEEVTR